VILEVNCNTGEELIIYYYYYYFLSKLEVLSWFRDFRFRLRNHLEKGEALKRDLLRTGMV
jgi:hypothetical protein